MNSPSPRRVRPWGQSLRLLRRLLRLLRLPQSWGGSDRTKFYHPPLPLRRGPPTPDHTTLATRPMVVMALLEPQKCCILQWFLSLFGNKRMTTFSFVFKNGHFLQYCRLKQRSLFERRVDPTSHRLSRPIWALPRRLERLPLQEQNRYKLCNCRQNLLPAPMQPLRRPT